jgi:prepilin-type N-terminal cleavage/methylation domain-containing protein
MKRRSRSVRGFTLVEVLVSVTLGALMMAAVLSSYVFLGRNLTRLANYQTLEAKGREALTYLRRDFALALTVKAGTSPTSSTVTLVLPAGEVTYTYAASTLTRMANFGANPTITLLNNAYCTCTAFSFNYYTTTGGSPLDQVTSSVNVPYSIKQIQVAFTLQTPSVHSVQTRATYQVASANFLLRNKPLPTGN